MSKQNHSTRMYESFYNLDDKPFEQKADARFFFKSEAHKHALANVRFGFHQREGIVVITGAPGIGKTEVMHNLVSSLPREKYVYSQIITTNLVADDVLNLIAVSFGISSDGEDIDSIRKAVEEFFLSQAEYDKRILLIVDDAHRLSIDSLMELEQLTRLEQEGKSVLQCFLLGQESLMVKLEDPKRDHLKNSIVASASLEPLSEAETQSYIHFRLENAGWKGDPSFDADVYPLIYQQTEGIPRQINALCNRVLLQGCLEKAHHIDEYTVKRAMETRPEEHEAYQQAKEVANSSVVVSATAENVSPKKNLENNPFINKELFEKIEKPETSMRLDDYEEETTLDLRKLGLAGPHPFADSTEQKERSSEEPSAEDTIPLWRKQPAAPPNNFIENTIHTKIDFNSTSNQSHALKLGADFPENEGEQKTVHYAFVPVEEEPLKDDSVDASAIISLYGDQKRAKQRHRGIAIAVAGVLTVAVLIPLVVSLTNSEDDALLQQGTQVAENDDLIANIKQLLPKQSNAESNQPEKSSNAALPVAENAQISSPAQGQNTVALANAQPTPANTESSQQSQAPTAENDGVQLGATTASNGAIGADVDLSEWDDGALPGAFTKWIEEEQQKQQYTPTQQAQVLPPTSPPQKDKAEPITTEQAVVAAQPQKTAPELSVAAPASQLALVNKPPASDSVSKQSADVTQKEARSNTALKPEAKQQAPVPTPTDPKPSKTTNSVNSANSSKKAPAVVASKPPKNAGDVNEKKLTQESSAATTVAPEPSQSIKIAKAAPPVVADKPVKNITTVISPTVDADIEISKAELNTLLSTLADAYENGDLNQLTSVLAQDIKSNDRDSRDDVKNDYKKLFNVTDMRKMTISSVKWTGGEEQKHGKGKFVLSVREKGAARVTSYDGNIVLEVQKSSNGVVITRLDYLYNN